ncbi:MAG: MATE family efflux transporter [Burkholderiaceae bacterium]
MTARLFSHSARRIAVLAWPVFVGQIAVLGFTTVDTVLVARASASDLAALAIGTSAYISIFIGLMGAVLAVGPIAGQAYGAGRPVEAGAQLHQAMWLALAISLPGCALLLFPEPFLALAQAPREVEAKARAYLAALAFALPPALLFTAFRGFNNAVSRPKIVMALQLGSLALKIPLSAALVFGFDFGALHIPALGVAGCGIATAIVVFGQLLAAWALLQRDPFYLGFDVRGRLRRPHRASLAVLARLGLPMGGAMMIETTGFAFMALFISRISAIQVAGHQLAANVAALLFMVPLSIGYATGALVAQRIGAGDRDDVERLSWHGMQLAMGIAALLGLMVFVLRRPLLELYTDDTRIIAAALPLLAWVACFHIADAGQAVASFVLRAHRIAMVPLLVQAVAAWGVGLGGGYWLAFGSTGPAALHGATGFWSAAALGLLVAGLGMGGYIARMFARQRGAAVATVA